MHAWTDTENRRWLLAINVFQLRRVKALTGVELPALLEDGGKPLGALLQNIEQLANVLWVLSEEEAKAAGIDEEHFARALAGDALNQAGDAFVEELLDFFPVARARAALKKTLAKGREVGERVLELAEAKLEDLDIEALAQSALTSSGSAPAASASTPAPSP